jgi:hypothetical protein
VSEILLRLSRKLAYAACDWTSFGHPDDLDKLEHAARVFRLAVKIKDTAAKIGN